MFFVFGHAGYASPTGELRNSNNGGLGLEAGAGIGLNKTFITATTGYTWLFVNKNGTTGGGLRYAPLRVGARRTVLLNRFFIKGDIGVAGMKYVDTDIKSTQLTTSFGVGIKTAGYEVLADLNSVTRFGSWWGVKLGFNFGL